VDISLFLDSVRQWAGMDGDIRAVVLVGSRARGKARPDSDIDLVILARHPEAYLENGFFYLFGSVNSISIEDWGRVTSIRVYYDGGCGAVADGLEVEFGLTRPDWVEMPLDSGTRRVLENGFQIVLDKDAALMGIL